MARIIGTPGESAAAGGLLRVGFVVVAYVFVLLPAVIWAIQDVSAKEGLAGLVGLTVAFGAILWWQRKGFAEAVQLFREGGHWLKGARGERLVSEALGELPNEYIVFNDFHPVDSATGKPAEWNVDHIVVGSNGVFVLDAKYYRNPFVPCATRSSFSRRNAKQVLRNAVELKQGLARWSAGDLDGLFVVPIVVYAQPDARTECLREGNARTIPLRLLLHEVQSHAEGVLDQEKAGRIARVLYSQIGRDLQYSFKPEYDAYGRLSKAARMQARDARLAQRAAEAENVSAAPAVPTVCPRCGGQLIRKVARFGERAGKPFLGCQNYSKTGCRYGFNVGE